MRTCIALAVLLVVLLPLKAHAHKVSVFAYAEDGRVFTESYFASGSRCGNCTVEVLEADSGRKLLAGKTNAEGLFSFAIPGKGAIRLVLKAGSGHGNDYTVSAAEIQEALGAAPPAPDTRTKMPGGALDEALDGALGAMGYAGVEAAMEKTLDRKLRPVMRELGRLREAVEKPGITEILGGIGYIIGLMGLAAYLTCRKKT